MNRRVNGAMTKSVPRPTPRALRGGSWSARATVMMLGILIIFMIVPEDFDYSLIGTSLPSSGDAVSRLIWFILLTSSAAAVLANVSFVRLIVRHFNPFFLGFIALACMSALWSTEPEFTLRRLIRLGTIALTTLAFIVIPGRSVHAVLRTIITLALIGSIVLVVLVPDLAIEHSGAAELVGAWHGLSTQKNGLGSLAAIAILLWLHAWLSQEVRWPTISVGACVSVVCLYFSRSSTSALATILAAPFMFFLTRAAGTLRRYVPYMVGLLAAGMLLYSLAVLRLVPGLEVLLKPTVTLTGKDLSFSGRTAVWNIVGEHIGQRPFLGSGYGAYWIGPIPGTPAYEHVIRLYFYPTEAHNGYLDVINDLGALGGACLLGYLLIHLRQSLRLYAFDRAQGALYLGLLFEQMLANLSESRWFNVLCVEFVVMTLATAAVGRALLEYNLQEQFGRYANRVGTAHRGCSSG